MSHYDDVELTSTYPGFIDKALATYAPVVISVEESFKAKPYHCSEGYPTVGYGQRIGPKHQPLDVYQFELPEPVAKAWLNAKVHTLILALVKHPQIAPALAQCNLVRQTVLVSMAYQLGVSGLAKFQKMLAAIESKDWQEAQHQGLDSLWAQQTPNRAKRHTHTLLTGH